MKTKICTKCGIEKDVSCFSKRKSAKDGLDYWCKSCCSQYNKQYSKNSALKRAKYHKQYRKDNAPQIAKRKKQHYEDNAPRLLEQKKQYHKENTPRIAKRQKQYYQNNAPQILKQKKQQSRDSALFDNYFKKLEIFEEVRRGSENRDLLQVRCAYCGKWVFPTNSQVTTRLRVFSGTMTGESRFYCSENCKQACPIYGQRKYPKGFKKATSREVVPLLRQLVLKRDNYTCQKCEATSETIQLHVHHVLSYKLNKMVSNDPDNCITLCKKCHKEIHSQDGCRYVDLQCPKDKE